MSIVAVETSRPAPTNPCQPSPCGPNSQCQVRGESPACSCLPSYIGAPPNCRPECVISPECSSNKACVNQKCRDPCAGACGSNAQCRVVNHTPMCTCDVGYTGDPFSYCVRQQGDVPLTCFLACHTTGVGWNLDISRNQWHAFCLFACTHIWIWKRDWWWRGGGCLVEVLHVPDPQVCMKFIEEDFWRRWHKGRLCLPSRKKSSTIEKREDFFQFW